MSSGLLIVSAVDVLSTDNTTKVLELAFANGFNHLFITISNKDMSHLLLMKCLSNIYDTAREIYGQQTSKVTVILYNSIPYMENVPWDTIVYTKSVGLELIPKSNAEVKCLDFAVASVPLNLDGGLTPKFNVSAVGGTFDHLHDGHRILLTISAFLTKDTLIIGITGPELLKNKSYADFMEKFNVRSSNVEEFLHLVKPDLHLNIQEINDVCGPTAQIEDINGLIVSKESMKGGEFVNNSRIKKHWKPLELVIIDVIGGKDNNFKDKLSSTDYRRIEFEKNNK